MQQSMSAPASPIASAAVALESTVITHGLPYPHNLKLARDVEEIIRQVGAVPHTIGIITGEFITGLSDAQMVQLAQSPDVHKISRRDLPIAKARSYDGSTTVATTMWLAARAGIQVFATGGIGGVHRGNSFDVSADLQELAQTSVIVVCAGAKAILDLAATVEYLETFGVTIVGWQTEEFPAFYSRHSGLSVDVRCEDAAEVAAIWRAKQALGLPGGLLVTVPIAVADEIPVEIMEPLIEQAVAEAEEQQLRSAEVTPFLLKRLVALSGEKSLNANLALLKQNAHVAAQIAVALQE